MENIILYNSRKLFYQVGYFKTKISNITKKCGISTGRFYRHFDSKEDLLVKVIRENLDVYFRDIKNFIPEDGEEEFKLKMLIRSIFTFLKKDPFFFAMLHELEEEEDKLSSSTKYWFRYFWVKTKILITDIIKAEEEGTQNKCHLISSMVESELKIYIKHLLFEKNGSYEPEKLLYLDVEKEVENVSAVVINTCRALNVFSSKNIIDPLTGAYINKYFFEMVDRVRSNGNPFHLVFLDLTFLLRNSKKEFFRDRILADMGSLLKKYSREIDSIGRLCNFKFMVLVPSKKFPQGTIDFKAKKISRELKNKYPFISPEDVVWKHIYIEPGDDIQKKIAQAKPGK